jgi:hypothetical protein
MKPGRVLLFGLGLVVLLLATAVALVFTSGFQTWAVRKALAGQPGLDVTVARVSANLDQVQLEHVHWVRNGAVLTLPAVEAELPVLTAALHQQVFIQRLVAHGWTLDLTLAALPTPPIATAGTSARTAREFALLPAAYADVPAAVAPLVFTGIFHQLRLPVDVSLAGVDLAGVVLLPALPGQPAARARVTLTGGELAAGHPGKFDYTAVIRFEGEGAAVRELRVNGTLGAVMDTPRTFTRVVAAIAAEAAGPKFPDGVKLSADLSAARTTAGENYALAVRTGAKQIAVIETSYAAGESHLRGAWRLDMHDGDLAPFMLGRELPTFEAVGDGRYDLDPSFAELNASGTLRATAAHLEAIDPGLAVLGSIQFAADFDVAQRGNATRVDRLLVTLTGAKPIATVQALQAFEFNLKTGELNVADPAKDLLGVVFQGLPLSWVTPLLGPTGLTVTGHELQGEFAASARNGGFALRPKAPLTMGNVSVSLRDGRPVLRAVDLSVNASADYSPQGWQVEFAPLSVSSRGAPLFALALKAGQLAGANQPIKLAGDWNVQLPALLAQPPAAGLNVLSGGQVQGEFAASLGAKREFQIKLAFTGLAANGFGELPALTADVRADLDDEGGITFNVPLLFDRAGRRSDLTVAGTLVPGAGGRILTARVSSDRLAIDDVQAFALPLLAPASPASGEVGAVPAAVSAPFWEGVTGQGVLALKKVIWSDQAQVTDLTGTLTLEPGALKLAGVQAGFGADSAVKLAGGLSFNPKATRAYGFDGDFSLENFDAGALFRAIDPTRPPTIEGRISLQSHLTGASASLADLPVRTRGDLRVTGRSGIFRAFSVDVSDRIQKTQSRVVAIGSLLGVVTDDFVNKTKILADIAKSLSEIPYDQLSLTATRDESLNLQLKDFTLISPEVRIGGSGTLRYDANAPIVSQPMDLQLALSTRGHLGDLMKRARLLEAQPDNLGYFPFSVPLKLGGTLERPDASAIRDALLNSALEKSGLLDSLFGKGK